MWTQEEINQQIQAIPDPYIFWTRKEVRMLPKLIDRNERIVGLTSGITNGKTWLAVCTTRRLLFINCNMFIGFEQIQMPLDRIQSIDQQFTLFFGSISVFDGINQFTLRMIRKSAIMPFVQATSDAMYNFKQGGTMQPARATSAPDPFMPSFGSFGAPAQSSGGGQDVASQLTKLADLKEKGHITDAEFQAQKKKLLG